MLNKTLLTFSQIMRTIFQIFLLSLYMLLVIGNQNITIVILSQHNNYSNKLANSLKNSILDQFKQLKLTEPTIYVSNKDFAIDADWTIIPLILPILESNKPNTQGVLFLEDGTHVNVSLLLKGLQQYDFIKEIWIGHELQDSEATIIHHFAFNEDPSFFKYPLLSSGMVISIPLLERLKTLILMKQQKKLDFHIDLAHEFALFVYNDGKGPMIENDKLFCSKEGPNCATYPKPFKSCGKPSASSIYFAVKTCQKYKDRASIVKKTWGKHTQKITYFSDHKDPEVPTTFLNVQHTEQGHCAKTIAILKWADQKFRNDTDLQWLALVDDDTILSVSRMAQLTTCHPSTSRPLMLGERYRFGVQEFDYATGGAGILINRAALKKLAQECTCPYPDAPDDMVLGAYAQQYGIGLVHVPQMHQARPPDYAPGRLANMDAITFHKHWMIDPIKVYHDWFEKKDQVLVNNTEDTKTEL